MKRKGKGREEGNEIREVSLLCGVAFLFFLLCVCYLSTRICSLVCIFILPTLFVYSYSHVFSPALVLYIEPSLLPSLPPSLHSWDLAPLRSRCMRTRTIYLLFIFTHRHNKITICLFTRPPSLLLLYKRPSKDSCSSTPHALSH